MYIFMNIADTRKWVQIGADHGARWGFLLALAYALWILWEILSTGLSMSLIAQISSGTFPTVPTSLEIRNIILLVFTIPLTLFVGGVMGGIPAILIGSVAGTILGGLLSHHTIRSSPRACFFTSLLFGIMSALLINIIGARLVLDMWKYPIGFHLSYIGLPSIVYIGVCLILSQRIPLLVERAHAKESPVEPSPYLLN